MKETVDHDAPGLITRIAGEHGYHGVNMPLLAYIRVAYQLRTEQISGPDWMANENFDVEAKAQKASTPDELHVMLQHLLEQRFHMQVRHESREQSGYILAVDNSGPKMKDHDPADKVMPPLMPGWGRHVGANVTMPYLAFYLSNEIGRTVVDKTGLDGHYDFEATWAGDGVNAAMPMPPPPNDNLPSPELRAMAPAGPTIFVALKQQLGLRLDAAKVPAPHLVIEHIEKLTGN